MLWLLLFTLITWLRIIKVDNCLIDWITDSPPPLSYLGGLLLLKIGIRASSPCRESLIALGRYMVNILRKDSLKFDGTNYDIQKEKMKSHLLCMGLGYWILTKVEKAIVAENTLESCTKE